MFRVIPGNFFTPLSSPNRIVYRDCICRLFSVMEHQLSFGVEREILVDELQYYFEQANAAEVVEEEFAAADARGKANGILRRLEFYGWIEIETDKSYVQRVNFKEYAVRLIKTMTEIIERLESKSRSRSYVKKAAQELAAMKEMKETESTELVYRYLHEIIEAFRNMDDILEEINRKNTQHRRRSGGACPVRRGV